MKTSLLIYCFVSVLSLDFTITTENDSFHYQRYGMPLDPFTDNNKIEVIIDDTDKLNSNRVVVTDLDKNKIYTYPAECTWIERQFFYDNYDGTN